MKFKNGDRCHLKFIIFVHFGQIFHFRFCVLCLSVNSVRAILPGKAISKMTYTVLGGMLNPTHSLTHSVLNRLNVESSLMKPIAKPQTRKKFNAGISISGRLYTGWDKRMCHFTFAHIFANY